ncbi:MAG: phenylalanine--tRNA ligase subunit beta, partial [Steroidobacteraceae bacterium]
MRVSYQWLREWVPFDWDARTLGERLTMAGFELEALEPAAPAFSGVVVAEILEVVPHPQADKLRVCRVSAADGASAGGGQALRPGHQVLQIVCGASNARAGLKTALAQIGALLPGDLEIKAAKLRGVESRGMLCSAKELGLAEGSGGILELPADAPVGQPLRDYLGLDDAVLELNVTPNRGDALSVLGIAREVSALSGRPLGGPAIDAVEVRGGDRVAVHLDAPEACPKFVGRIVRGVDNHAATPQWMRERLRRAGLRSISPVVDATNYVMLELGQPLHAYDLARLRGDVHVRMARAGEPLVLLDGREVALDPDMLVIADGESAVGVAGIMGGERTAVNADTTDVYLEVAYFSPEAIAGRARRLSSQTDASQRFERGVDPAHQERALERATALIQAMAGGSAEPAVVTEESRHLPRRLPVRLRSARITRLLGAPVDSARVEAILTSLGIAVARTAEGWTATAPPHRFDIAIEPDLIEEVARIEGYAAFAERDAAVAQRFGPLPQSVPPEGAVLENLAARGYQEAITYAFVDPGLQSKLLPEVEALALANPIASDLSVMRASLWPGLLRVALENQRRQQERVRLFEHGTRFAVSKRGDVGGGPTGHGLAEIDSLAGLALGPRLPEQWGLPTEARVPVDFFDVKADVEALLGATGAAGAFAFEAAALSCLHPGRSARILRQEREGASADAARGQPVGWIGELHPRLVRDLGLTGTTVLFELDFAAALRVEQPRAGEVSRFPHVRRDIAVLVEEAVTLSALRDRVTLAASS